MWGPSSEGSYYTSCSYISSIAYEICVTHKLLKKHLPNIYYMQNYVQGSKGSVLGMKTSQIVIK